MVSYPPNSLYDPGTFKRWFSGPLGWATGVRCYFNSALSTESVSTSSNATLTIYLRLHLVQRNKDSGIPLKTEDNKDLPLRDWNDADGEFAKFKDAAKREAEKFWNATGFCLLLPNDYRGLDWPHSQPMVHPNVDCRFQIVWANGPRDAHAAIDCFRPDVDNPILSPLRSNVGSGKGQFSVFDTALHNSDLTRACEKKEFVLTGTGLEMEYRTIQAKCVVPRMTLPHEIGHLLGLPHVGQFRKDPDCVKAIGRDPVHGNGDHSCYTGPGPNDAENVMGQGMQLADWNAMPWERRADRAEERAPAGAPPVRRAGGWPRPGLRAPDAERE
jgi:hypothetical protein